MAEDIWSKMLKPYTVQPTAASAIAFKATKVFPWWCRYCLLCLIYCWAVNGVAISRLSTSKQAEAAVTIWRAFALWICCWFSEEQVPTFLSGVSWIFVIGQSTPKSTYLQHIWYIPTFLCIFVKVGRFSVYFSEISPTVLVNIRKSHLSFHLLHFVYILLPVASYLSKIANLWTKKCQIPHKKGTMISVQTTNLVILKTCKTPGFLGTLNNRTSVQNQFNKPLLQV